MEKIYLHWKTCFYTEALLVGLLVVALWVSIKNRNKHQELKYFPIYFIFLLAVFISLYANVYSENVTTYSLTIFNFHHYIDYASTLIELFVFLHFFTRVLENQILKRWIIGLSIAFVIYYFTELFLDNLFARSVSEAAQSRVYTIESLILLIPCIGYFYELFKRTTVASLKDEPSFWIVSGLSFFVTCTLPYSLMENYLRKNNFYLMTALYSVFYIFYIILLSMILKAYRCSQKKPI